MALKIELKGTSPGLADLAISGGGSDPGPVEITIQRNQDEHYLASAGSWQATPYWHMLGDIRPSADGIVAVAGPEIVDAIVESAVTMQFLVNVKSAGVNGQQVMRRAGRLLGSGAAGSGQSDPPPPPLRRLRRNRNRLRHQSLSSHRRHHHRDRRIRADPGSDS